VSVWILVPMTPDFMSAVGLDPLLELKPKSCS